jgi:DNA-binding CsgD family transcriptional regulator
MPRPNIEFNNENDLVKFTFTTLVNAGMTPEQIERLRLKSSDPGYIFSKEVLGQRRFATSELLAAGLSNSQIAKVFRSSKETVSSDREHIRKLYTDSILQNADNWRAKLLKEQDDIKAKALTSFEESKIRRIRRVQERNGDQIVTNEEFLSAGDPAFLNVAKGCLEQQAKLLGLFEARRSEASEEKSYKQFLSNLSKEVKKIREAERNIDDRSSAIDADFDEDGQPIGDARPMLPADDSEDDPEDSLKDVDTE